MGKECVTAAWCVTQSESHQFSLRCRGFFVTGYIYPHLFLSLLIYSSSVKMRNGPGSLGSTRFAPSFFPSNQTFESSPPPMRHSSPEDIKYPTSHYLLHPNNQSLDTTNSPSPMSPAYSPMRTIPRSPSFEPASPGYSPALDFPYSLLSESPLPGDSLASSTTVDFNFSPIETTENVSGFPSTNPEDRHLAPHVPSNFVPYFPSIGTITSGRGGKHSRFHMRS